MKLLDNYIAKNLKKQEEKTNQYMAERDATAVFPTDVEEIKNVPYGDGPRARLDIYRPKMFDGALPVLVDFHGGGLLLCDKEFNRYYCAELARHGLLVFNAEYPLAPETKVYDILREADRAVKQAQALAADYGGDSGRFALVGDSAGGWLALYVAAAWKSPELGKALEIQPGSLPIHALGIISGEYYVRTFDGKNSFLRSSYYGKKPKQHPFAPYVNPDCPAVAASLPPVYLQTGSGDHLREETLRFAKALAANGADYQMSDYEGDPTETRHVFPVVAPTGPKGAQAVADMAEFFKARL